MEEEKKDLSTMEPQDDNQENFTPNVESHDNNILENNSFNDNSNVVVSNLDTKKESEVASDSVQESFEVVEPKYEEVKIEKKETVVRTDSYFDGKLLELFGWTILKNLITIITLGIAGPWGECMLLDFEISHTSLNGKRLKFKGTGGSLFVEYFKWIFLSIITLGIYAFWIPVKKTKWILSNIYFEDEGYVRDESYFDGKVLQLIGINILCGFLTIVSFGILYPFTECIKLRWIAKHSVINRKKVVFEGSALNLFGHYILWLFLTIITFGIYGFWLKIKMIKWKVKHSRLKMAGEPEQKDKSIFVVIIVFFILLITVIAFFVSNPPNFEDFDPFGSQSQIGDPLYDDYYYDDYYSVQSYYN